MKNRLLILAFVLAFTSLGCSLQAKLKVGDPAPKLQVSEWAQGDAVTIEKGKAYIVEFWATWCGPCRTSIPHLNEIHLKYKDKGLVVIGQDVFERDTKLVKPFIKQMGDKMTYRVALDSVKGGKGQMATTWMEAAGLTGIPAAFVVDKQGRIAWIGHPMGLPEDLITKVLDGTFDPKKAAAANEAEGQNRDALAGLRAKLSQATKDKQWTEAESVLDEMAKLVPDHDGVALARLRLYAAKNDEIALEKAIQQRLGANTEDPTLLNEIAWTLATTDEVGVAALAVAEAKATQANEIAHGKEPAILKTIARIAFLKGKKNRAMDFQQRAIDVAERKNKDELRKALASYQAGKLPSVP